MDNLPEELVRHISDYGGIYTAKDISQTSSGLRSIYNPPGIMEEIRRHKSSIDECRMYEETMEMVNNAMRIIYSILFQQDNISAEEAEMMVLDYDPDWFSLEERMFQKSEEYIDTRPFEEYLPVGHQGPKTHAWERAQVCSDLLSKMALIVSVFNSWIADVNGSDYKQTMISRITSHIDDLKAKYVIVDDLHKKCIDARLEPIPRHVYRIGKPQSRRRRTPKKIKKIKFALRNRDMIHRLTESIVTDIQPYVLDAVSQYPIESNVFGLLQSPHPRSGDWSRDWVAVFRRDLCRNDPFEFTGTLNEAILDFNEHLEECSPDGEGTINYWIQEITSPLSIRDMLYDMIRPMVEEGKPENKIYEKVEREFSEPGFTFKVYSTLRDVIQSTDIARLEAY